MANSSGDSRGLKRSWPFPDQRGPRAASRVLSVPGTPSFSPCSTVEADNSHHPYPDFNGNPFWNPGSLNEAGEYPQRTSNVDLEAEHSNEDSFDPSWGSTTAAPESLQLETCPNNSNDQSNVGFDYGSRDPTFQLHKTSSCLEDLAANVCFGAVQTPLRPPSLDQRSLTRFARYVTSVCAICKAPMKNIHLRGCPLPYSAKKCCTSKW